MKNLKACKEELKQTIKNTLEEIEILKNIYSSLFKFEDLFSTENSGKTKLNRQFFNSKNLHIQNHILKIQDGFSSSLGQTIFSTKELLINNKLNDLTITDLFIDDDDFFEELEETLNSQKKSNSLKNKVYLEIEELINLKNKILNVRYFIEQFDTSDLNIYLNKIPVEELIDNKFIFEFLEAFALHVEELDKLKFRLNSLFSSKIKKSTIIELNNFMDLENKKYSTYSYGNIDYKINIDYINSLKKIKEIDCDSLLLENILAYLLEQSCLDLVKKDLKKGKFNKVLEIKFFRKKKKINFVFTNNGLSNNNIKQLFLSNESKFLIQSKNLAKMINATLEIIPKDDDGMTYILELQ